MGWQDAPELAPAEQAMANVPAWMAAPELEKPKSSTGVDILKTVVGSPVRVAAGMIGLPGDVAHGMRWLNNKAMTAMGFEDRPDYVAGTDAGASGAALTPESPDIINAFERNVAELHRPEGRPAKYAGSVADMTLGAAAGPGNTVRSLLRYGVAPGVASEAAGQATEGTKLEPWARAAAGLGAAGLPSLARGSAGVNDTLREALREVTPQQFAAAAHLMQDAHGAGVRLTWPEAIQQATNSGTPLGNLQRVAEGSQRGSAVLRPIMSERPAEVQQAATQQFQTIAPGVPMNPTQVGMQGRQAAENVIENTRREINRATTPAYAASGADNIPARTLARLHNVPGFTDALAEVRGNPHLNQGIANLPDTSVRVLNEVEKLLGQQGENMGRITNPNRNVQIAVSNQRSAEAVDTVARRNSANYRNARDTQAARRAAELDPLTQGPMGQLAEAGDVTQLGNRLLPQNPAPNTAAETGRTVRALAGENLQATRNVIRSRLEGQFQRSTQDLQGGIQEFGGANFRKAMYGNQQLQRNVRAALTELPNGANIAAGFDRFMEIMQATGRRQHIGSQTEFNRLLTDRLGELGPGADMFTTVGNLRPVGFLRDRLQRWQLGRNMEELARVFSDPGAQQRLQDLVHVEANPARTLRLIAQLVKDFNKDSD